MERDLVSADGIVPGSGNFGYDAMSRIRESRRRIRAVAVVPLMNRTLLFAASASFLVAGCDGPQENAGEKKDAAAHASGGVFQDGPQERLGEIEDRAAHDRDAATKAQAKAIEDHADAIKETADQEADALEKRAKDLRREAGRTAKTLDSQADAIKGN